MTEALTNETGPESPTRRRGPPVRIDTERFTLESLTPEHASAVAEWMSSSRTSAALGQVPITHSIERTVAYIASFDQIRSYIFGIRVRSTDALVGFYTFQIDPHETGSINLVIGEEGALRQAVAIETARALVDWAFNERGLEKVTARVAESNRITANWLGTRMTLEGCLREQIKLPDGSRVGVLMFGLLKREWQAVRSWSVENQAQRHPTPPTDRRTPR